jgi:asparagine synthase (glutamine-hydrolysing)
MYDEPFADSSQIPTFLVSQLARRHVTVSLSGDGGDEIFGGYNRHTWIGPLWHKLKPIPVSLRRLGAAAVTALPPRVWDSVYRGLRPVMSPAWRQSMPGYKLHKLANIMASSTVDQMYFGLTSHWLNPQLLMRNSSEPPTLLTNGTRDHLPTAAEEMMYLDAMTYLPDDILAKVDRATMAVSLEGRIPFLDHRVAEFAWKLPLSFRIRGHQGKWIVRQLLYRYVPRELVDRPKSGFGIPLGAWLRGPLREWAEALLDEGRLRREGWFDPLLIRRAWREHLAGRRPWEYQLWDVLMFQAWLEGNARQPDSGSRHQAYGDACDHNRASDCPDKRSLETGIKTWAK